MEQDQCRISSSDDSGCLCLQLVFVAMVVMRLAAVEEVDICVSLCNGDDTLAADIANLLEATARAFERRWYLMSRSKPLLDIGLDDVEAWLDSGRTVRADDVELFALPPKTLAGRGGNFHSDPQPVPEKNRLKKVRKAFGEGQALVINSLHRWCPKAARLASTLFKQIGLPVDVYMYLTPPYSHSYGLHTDVMDAFMVQLVGSKHWTVCDGQNCSDVKTAGGDILYLPMGARHSAWTTNEMSAHLTVNVERQFYVWGSILQALVPRLLVPQMRAKLDTVRDMSRFGMEGGNQFAVFVGKLGIHMPTLLKMPETLLNHTRYGLPLKVESLENEWHDLVNEFQNALTLSLWKSSVTVGPQTYKPAAQIVQELVNVDSELLGSSLRWIAKLLQASVKQMQQERGEGNPPQLSSRGPQKLGEIAAARVAKFQETNRNGQEL